MGMTKYRLGRFAALAVLVALATAPQPVDASQMITDDASVTLEGVAVFEAGLIPGSLANPGTAIASERTTLVSDGLPVVSVEAPNLPGDHSTLRRQMRGFNVLIWPGERGTG